jgi:hypothetical protein
MGQRERLAYSACLLALLLTSSMRAAADGPKAPDTVSSARLDLRAPSLTHVLSSGQIAALTNDLAETSPESVTVRGSRDTTACCGAFIALPWALMHPRTAWRIFTPVTGACRGMWCTDHGD